MNHNVARLYFTLCDLHNRYVNSRDDVSADKVYHKAQGVLDCYEATGGNVGELLTQADLYVSAKFDREVKLCGGLLLERVNDRDLARSDGRQRSVAEPDAEGRALCQSGPRAVEADDRNGVQDKPAAPTI